ncbi:hypothetical protein SAMN05192561_101792 [Halopenitus malekzadehii]|uniref:Uncharacterized protein n=1 Tax=Halopenitus malekzadehii TaxID=1267564 RepID=A0A1H6I4H9_9EURY|nr:DUF5799 family protein [Halopenitus malekzadehii]SEH41525.1 hypothetical protein SAMN05192561_101792 [Halopenitus malekzadehii]
MSDWTDAIVGDRMAVDQEFNDRVMNSQFSNQEWGLIMTATELEIENPEDPDRARIVADTSKLPEMMPELDSLREQMPGAAGGGGGSGGGGSGGFLGSVRSALGLDGDDGEADAERLEAAETMTQEYAERLQQRLEDNGKFERARTAYLE